MRLDKFLCEMNIGTRSQVKSLLKQGMVSINGVIVKNADQKVDENLDIIAYKGERLRYQQFHYYMLNKPQDVVTATKDNVSRTVMDLFPASLRKNLFPVGRLDKDTEGLLLITDDGELAHRLLAPNKHVDKTYLVGIASELTKEACHTLENGVDIGEERLTGPAKVQVLNAEQILLTIQEGKFHQVKRMLKAVDNQVISLKRIQFGPLSLDEALHPGEYRELTDSEVALLHEKQHVK